jgi:hypothetical protein
MRILGMGWIFASAKSPESIQSPKIPVLETSNPVAAACRF